MRKLFATFVITVVGSIGVAPVVANGATASTTATVTCGTPTGSNYPAPAIGTKATYPASDAGTVTIKRRTSTVLRVKVVTPNAGWRFRVPQPSGDKVRVTFTNATTVVRFAAHLNTTLTMVHTSVNTCTKS